MPPKKAAPKKEAPAKKPAVKRAPRKKAEPKATVNEMPVVEEVKPTGSILSRLKAKLLSINPLYKYGILILLALVLFGVGKRFFKKRAITKGQQKIEKLHVKEDSQQENVDILNDRIIMLEERFKELYEDANKATEERKETEKRGEQIRTETKNKTDETIKRIQNPRNTDADRERLARELLLRPSHDYSHDTIR